MQFKDFLSDSILATLQKTQFQYLYFIDITQMMPLETIEIFHLYKNLKCMYITSIPTKDVPRESTDRSSG